MRLALFALAAGLLSLLLLPHLPPTWLLLVVAGLGVPLLAGRWYPVGFFLLGFGWACCSAQWALDDRLASRFDGRTLWLEGLVEGLPDVQAKVVRFELVEAQSRRGRLPEHMRLSWYGGPRLQAGERWRLAVNLRAPQGMVNPAGLDYEAWLLARRVGATGTVKAGYRLAAASGVGAWRDRLRTEINGQSAWGRQGGLAALVVGDSSGLTTAAWRLLQTTGTVHLAVISGEHITLVAGLIYGLIAGAARRGWWPRRLPWLGSACLAAFLGTLGYGFLAGFDVPVQRACAMLALVLLWRWRFSYLGPLTPLLVAMVLVLLIEPLACLQPGFWLSFMAVAVLVFCFSGRLGRWGFWASLGRAQWAVTLGLLPVTLALALPISLTAPIANIIAAPWVGLGVVPLALRGSLRLPIPGLGSGLLWLAGGSLALVFGFLHWISTSLPVWMPTALPTWGWLLVSLGCVYWLLPAGMPGRVLAPLLLLPLFWPAIDPLPGNRAQVWMLDVGQGLSVLVRTRHHQLLYDAGPKVADFDTGERVVVPSLHALGVNRLDLMLLSHADSDHAGGALAVQQGLKVKRVISGEPRRLARQLAAGPCGAQQWQWDDVRFATWRRSQPTAGNDSSCVLRVEANGEALLLTGDLGKTGEARLLRQGFAARADWLLLGHHGSKSSTSAAFVEAVKPRVALISRGRNNRFGHPHPQVLAILKAHGAALLDTPTQGCAKIRLGDFAPPWICRQAAAFWRRAGPVGAMSGGKALVDYKADG